MSDEAKSPKKEIEYVDPTINVGEDDVVTYIGSTRGANTKYGVVFPVMVDEDFLKERYNMTLKEVVQAGIRQISTRPNYGECFTADGVDHEKMQKIADDYKPGSRAAAGPKVTKEQAKLGRLAAKEADGKLTAEEIMEAIAAAKAKKGL